MTNPSNQHPYAPAILRLLRDVLYTTDKEWETLLTYQAAVQHHFAQIGLQLIVDEAEGYAYLLQPENAPDETPLPRLVSRLPLTYDATLLSVLLREALQQFDATRPDETRLILTTAEITETMSPFYAERNDMTRFTKQIRSFIGQVERVGFLKQIGKKDEERFEVKRIIKAKISADKINEILTQLKQKTAGNETDAEEQEND